MNEKICVHFKCGNCTSIYQGNNNNTTGLQPVSRTVEQILVQKFQKICSKNVYFCTIYFGENVPGS